VPYELVPAEFAALVDRARELRAAAGRADPFTLVAPFAVAADAGAERLLEDAARWRAAGATAFHVGIGAASWSDYLDRLAWFGHEVAPRVE
jgi:hypothetical protein